MKGKQIKAETFLAMIQLSTELTKLLDKDPVEASIFDDADTDLNRLNCGFANFVSYH